MMRRVAAALDVKRAATVGGKAASLAWLRAAGFRVPAFTVISIQEWISEDWGDVAFREAFAANCEHLEFASDEFAISTRAASLRMLLRSAPLPAGVEQIISRWTARPESTPFTFARSSAASEDSLTASSAGQYESVLVRTDADMLREAILRVVESYYGERAVKYRRTAGLPQEGPRMAVILQDAVVPTASGIVFGCDPATGNIRVIVIESSYGFGTAIVTGAVSPDRFVVEKDSLEVVASVTGSKRIADRLDDAGRTCRTPVDVGLRRKLSIHPRMVTEIASCYRRIEQLAGVPQDVEWAVEGSCLWILQSRPITSPMTGEVEHEHA